MSITMVDVIWCLVNYRVIHTLTSNPELPEGNSKLQVSVLQKLMCPGIGALVKASLQHAPQKEPALKFIEMVLHSSSK